MRLFFLTVLLALSPLAAGGETQSGPDFTPNSGFSRAYIVDVVLRGLENYVINGNDAGMPKTREQVASALRQYADQADITPGLTAEESVSMVESAMLAKENGRCRLRLTRSGCPRTTFFMSITFGQAYLPRSWRFPAWLFRWMSSRHASDIE